MIRVFVGGCQRSGTSVTAREIARRWNLVFLPEAPFLTEMAGAACVGDQRRSGASLRKALVRTWGLPVSSLKDAGLGSRGFDVLVERYAGEIGVHAARGWVEHSPSNLAQRALLQEQFPDAVFIHVVRDGRAVFASVKNLDFGPRTAIGAARWWLSNIAPGLAAHDAGMAEQVRFEDVLSGSGDWLVDLEARIGAPVNGCDAAVMVTESPYSSGHQRRLTGPLDEARREAWRAELGSEEADRFETIAGSTLHALGYSPSQNPKCHLSWREEIASQASEILGDGLLQRPRRAVRTVKSVLRPPASTRVRHVRP